MVSVMPWVASTCTNWPLIGLSPWGGRLTRRLCAGRHAEHEGKGHAGKPQESHLAIVARARMRIAV
jgi:hypothetical protein